MNYTFLKLLPLCSFALAWQWFCSGNTEREFLFATPELLFAAARTDLVRRQFWIEVGYTCFEALSGLVAGTLTGSLAGLLLWAKPPLARIAKPYLTVLGSVPLFAVAPLFIIWFGTGVLTKCIMAGLAVYFVALHQALEAARSIHSGFSTYLRANGASSLKIVQKVVFPGTLQWIIAALRLNIGLAFLGAFVGELVSSELGLGHYILHASALYDMPRVFLGVIVLSTVAVLLNAFVGRLARRW